MKLLEESIGANLHDQGWVRIFSVHRTWIIKEQTWISLELKGFCSQIGDKILEKSIPNKGVVSVQTHTNQTF